jgi:hypothetical protein
MKINLLVHVRKHRGEHYMGRWMARRIHIYTSDRSLIRMLRGKIANRRHRIGPQFKSTRIAFYAGAMSTLRKERRFCALMRL